MDKQEWMSSKVYSPRENNLDIEHLQTYEIDLERMIRECDSSDDHETWLLVELAKVRKELRERKRGVDRVF